MSVSNDGVSRFQPIAVDAIEKSFISGLYKNAAQPVVCIGSLPNKLGASYLELNGGNYIDFHYQVANVATDYDARITCSAPTAAAAESASSSINITASSLLLTVPVSSTFNKMDVIGLALIIPANAPLMACYTANGVGAITVPVASPGQRFSIRNSTGAAVAVNFAGGITAMGGGAVPAAIPAGSSWAVSCIQVAADAYAWGVAPVAPFVVAPG